MGSLCPFLLLLLSRVFVGMMFCLKGCLSGLLTEAFKMQSQNTLTMPLLCTFLLIKTGKGAQSAGVQLHFPRLAA